MERQSSLGKTRFSSWSWYCSLGKEGTAGSGQVLLLKRFVLVLGSGSRLESQGLQQCFGSGGPRDKLKVLQK